MRIAVTDTGREDKQKLYLDWLRTFAPNAELVVISYRNPESSMEEFDGLVLTGGEDIDPKYSKTAPIEKVGKVNALRDQFEFKVLGDALHNNIPVLGVCRGMQVANVFLGGTLVADLQSDGFNKHAAKEQEPIVCHSIKVKENTLMHDIVGATAGEINSYHHQGVKNIAIELLSGAVADDGVVESLEWKEKNGKQFFLAVQWHPERMKETENPFTQKVGSSFISAVKKFENQKHTIPHTQ